MRSINGMERGHWVKGTRAAKVGRTRYHFRGWLMDIQWSSLKIFDVVQMKVIHVNPDFVYSDEEVDPAVNNQMIDFVLDRRDKEWFMELSKGEVV